jgi:hypothetical protein
VRTLRERWSFYTSVVSALLPRWSSPREENNHYLPLIVVCPYSIATLSQFWPSLCGAASPQRGLQFTLVSLLCVDQLDTLGSKGFVRSEFGLFGRWLRILFVRRGF